MARGKVSRSADRVEIDRRDELAPRRVPASARAGAQLRFVWLLALALPLAQIAVSAHAVAHSPADRAGACAVCAAGPIAPLPATERAHDLGPALSLPLLVAYAPSLAVSCEPVAEARAPPALLLSL